MIKRPIVSHDVLTPARSGMRGSNSFRSFTLKIGFPEVSAIRRQTDHNDSIYTSRTHRGRNRGPRHPLQRVRQGSQQLSLDLAEKSQRCRSGDILPLSAVWHLSALRRSSRGRPWCLWAHQGGRTPCSILDNSWLMEQEGLGGKGSSQFGSSSYI
jgi:hypothetical protein